MSSGRLPASTGWTLSALNTAFVSTTAFSGSEVIWPRFGRLTLVIIGALAPVKLRNMAMPSSPLDLSENDSSPATSRRLRSRSFCRLSIRQATVVRPNFHCFTCSGLRRYHVFGMNSAKWRSPAAAIRPKRRNRSKWMRFAEVKLLFIQWSF
ncbi:hypothetical protein D3C81_1693050 [compost metagenome]